MSVTVIYFNITPDRNALVDDDKNHTVFLGINTSTFGINTTFPEFDSERRTEKLPLNYSLMSVSILVAALGIIGNFVTMAKILYDSKLHTPTYAAIGHLAFADFFALIVVTFHLFMATRVLEFTKLWMQLTIVSITDTIYLSSACHVLLLSSVKYLITVHPLQSRRRLTIKAVSLCSLPVWLISFLFGVLKSYLFYVYLQTKSKFMMLINGITYTILLVLVCFITISLHVWKIRALQISRSTTRHLQKRMNLVVTAIIAVFAIFQIFIITRSLFIYNNNDYDSGFIPIEGYTFLHLSVILSGYFTYSINPYIFFFLSIFLSCRKRKTLNVSVSTNVQALDISNSVRSLKMIRHFSKS